MMKILITGVAGFLGSHICEYLLKERHHVVGVDNLITGNILNLQNLDIDLTIDDICNPLRIDGLDLIIHLASPASPVAYYNHPIRTLQTGSIGTDNILKMAVANNAKVLIASTSEVYGDPLEHPQKETYYGNVNPIGLRSCYDEAKRFQEALTMAYHRKHGLDIRIVRIFNTYGPRMAKDDGRVIPNFINQALEGKAMTIYGDGLQTRSFCYVDDLVEGIMTVIEKGDNMPYNIGNPTEINMKDLAHSIYQLAFYGATPITYKDIYADDPKVRCPDISRISELGWMPKVQLVEGLINTIKYFKDR